MPSVSLAPSLANKDLSLASLALHPLAPDSGSASNMDLRLCCHRRHLLVNIGLPARFMELLALTYQLSTLGL